MKRAEIWWVNFDPSVGGDIQKRRPAVIVSNDAANYFLNRVQVVPLTGSTDRLYPSEAYVILNGKQAMSCQQSWITFLGGYAEHRQSHYNTTRSMKYSSCAAASQIHSF